MTPISLSRSLARFAVDLSFQDLPEEVVERCKVSILNVFSPCFAGRDLPWSRTAVEIARKGHGPSTILVYGDRGEPADAALANAVMAHSILLEDFAPGLGHPGISVVPAALAVAEETGVSGADLITAVVAGYEVLMRVGLGLRGKLHAGFGESSVLGTFGAAVSVGKLLKLNEDQMMSSIGYAATFASGTLEHWIHGSMEGMFQAGMSARNGVFLANLAGKGAVAAETALEGLHGFYRAFTGNNECSLKDAIADMGSKFYIMQTLIKQYPSCGANQATLNLGLSLHEQYQVQAKNIERVIERVSPWIVSGPGNNSTGPFTDQFQAQMSTQFCLAAALLGKSVKSASIFARHYDDPEILEVVRKIELVPEEGRDWLNPRIEVLAKNGRHYFVEENRLAKFIPDRETAEKSFQANTADQLSKEKASEIINAVMNLDKLDVINKLTTLLG